MSVSTKLKKTSMSLYSTRKGRILCDSERRTTSNVKKKKEREETQHTGMLQKCFEIAHDRHISNSNTIIVIK
jgi:hypothetical protein